MNQKPDPVETARRILKTKHPQAEVAFVAGSIVRGEETQFSDIDLVIVYSKTEFPYRESFLFDSWPVEAFVHDPDTVNYFFEKVDGQSGDISLPSMILDGHMIPERSLLGSRLKERAGEFVAQGPPAWSVRDLENARYAITDLVDDIRGYRNLIELFATLGALHESLANFHFRANLQWSASRKHIPRRLQKQQPQFAVEWNQAFRAAYGGEVSQLIHLTERILAPFGGFYFDGYRRDAPKEWRLRRDT